MKREDWLVAGAVAAVVAIAVVAAGLPPVGWAADSARITIPSLPPAELQIPEMKATVKASAERKAGQAVAVKLELAGSPENAGMVVPLSVQVVRVDPATTMSRMIPTLESMQVAKADCSLTVSSDGKAEAIVELPLTWTEDVPKKAEKTSAEAGDASSAKAVTNYYIVLASPLAPGSKMVRLGEMNVLTESSRPKASERLAAAPAEKSAQVETKAK